MLDAEVIRYQHFKIISTDSEIPSSAYFKFNYFAISQEESHVTLLENFIIKCAKDSFHDDFLES